MWGIEVRVARERNFARARMTKTKAVDPQRQALARVRALMPASMEPEPMWMQAPQELPKREPGPTELLPEQEPLRVENPRKLAQGRRIAEPRAQAGHLLATLRELARARWKQRELLAWSKNNVRPPQLLRAWAALGKEVPRKRQAFLEGGTWLPACQLLGKRKWVARTQDWPWRRSRRRGER